ncbi:DUF6288 domain-containing protein [Haloferula sp. A504]|uniref:DUF6288 domain-containing protein n=1 Tax=Haloferula sp. A504 TaxID=3373601 RepID=UPI0031C1EDE8|nr:DUF6288 domain-containing protein [Verrucomicrobiaceae bacterium E54]
MMVNFGRNSPAFVAGLLISLLLSARLPGVPNPDFTKGEPLPVKEAPKDWNLGATGLRGWMHTQRRLSTDQARQVYITQVDKGSPADGIFKRGDVLLGVGGQPFRHDPRTEIGKALSAAEAADGKLALTRWRQGGTEEVILQLQNLGPYSPTAPYDCGKSYEILNQSCEALAGRMKEPGYGKQNPIVRSLNALGLLASGNPKYHPLIQREAEWAADYSTESFATWWYGYVTVFLGEYILATGDTSVLPGLRRIAMEAAKGQSMVGSWGHKFANPDGRLPGYGMMNSPGAVLTIGMVLAREAGVKDPEVVKAIERSVTLLRFYSGKGCVPYGDHAPYMKYHEDNGKNGMAAVLFDQLGDAEATRFFTKMSTAAHGRERDTGHTGNFFNITWAMPGVARGGPHATGAWMQEFGAWYFDLARKWDHSFPHQGPPQAKKDSYGNWDATGMYLIAYAMPRKAIRLTGSKPFVLPPFGPKDAAKLIVEGHPDYAEGKFSAFSSWSPIIRERAAEALAKQKDAPVEPFIRLLDSPSLEARQGACTALGHMRERAEPAIPKLLETLKADDLWLRVKATEALAAIGDPAKQNALPVLLKRMAIGPTEEDPRAMEQRYIVAALFHPRTGMLRRSIKGVDRELLLAGIESALQNEDGWTRGNLRTLYEKLSLEELRPIMPAVQRAIRERAPSGIMFDGQIQDAGLELYSRNLIDEGIEMIATHIRTQKPHGSRKRVPKYIEMLKRYGTHAQRAIPLLEKAEYYFEHVEDFPKWAKEEKLAALRKGIREIKALKKTPELVELGL